ncbi:hypothetical protein OsI_01016 [Oryza sativa Indica Group]|uniref:Uncharacterized protein n=1 Tax=Oryza sativa subsp. indica TaxID=39946 RepID=A2WME7_ORYSI|nr:hypothetical protein OsI_01016 [Oryza sativa Indica Group]
MGTEEKKHRQQSRSRSRRKDVTGKGSRCEVASKASEDGRVQKRHKQGYTRTTLPSFPLLYVLDRPTLQPDASLAAAFHPCLPACTRSSARSSELIARCCCACGFGGVGQVGEYERCHSVLGGGLELGDTNPPTRTLAMVGTSSGNGLSNGDDNYGSSIFSLKSPLAWTQPLPPLRTGSSTMRRCDGIDLPLGDPTTDGSTATIRVWRGSARGGGGARRGNDSLDDDELLGLGDGATADERR